MSYADTTHLHTLSVSKRVHDSLNSGGAVQPASGMSRAGWEIVVFTAATQDYADWMLDLVDTERRIQHRLYRQHACAEPPGAGAAGGFLRAPVAIRSALPEHTRNHQNIQSSPKTTCAGKRGTGRDVQSVCDQPRATVRRQVQHIDRR